MRVAVVYFAVKNRDALQKISHSLAKGIQSQGHLVDVIDAINESDKKLTIYQYIAVGTESTSLYSGKISDKIKEFLAGSGAVMGKMSFAFLSKAAFAGEKTLLRLMQAMEAQGMVIKSSEILKDAQLAEYIGKKLRIE